MEFRKCLIYEDDQVALMSLEMMVNKLGYSILNSYDSADNLTSEVITYDPDFVLMDITLTGEKNGLEATKELRNYENVPVIFLTAHSDRKTVDEIGLMKNSYLINKPYTEMLIDMKLKELFKS